MKLGQLEVFVLFVIAGMLSLCIAGAMGEISYRNKREAWRQANNCFEKSRNYSGEYYWSGNRRVEKTKYVYKCEPEGREPFNVTDIR